MFESNYKKNYLKNILNNYLMKKYKNLIGKGSYGYIFSPPLDFDYEIFNLEKDKKYVTKLTTLKDGLEELKHNDLICNIDVLNEYHLGKYYISPVKKENIDIDDFKLFDTNDYDDICIIIQKYGGNDLYEGIKNNMIKNYDEFKKFIIEFYRILNGLKILNDNNILHHDINPKNIVYDIKTNRLNLIDFNLTNKKENIKLQILNSNYEFAIFHNSFPIETGFYNKNDYEKLKSYTEKDLLNYWNFIKQKVLYNIKIDNDLINSIKLMFSYYYLLDEIKKNNKYKESIIENLKIFFFEIKNYDYDDFIDKSLNTFDLYGYGLTLLYAVRLCDKYIPTKLSDDLYDFILEIINLNVFERPTIEEVQKDFLNILENHKIINNK